MTPSDLETNAGFHRAVLQAVNEIGLVPVDLRTGTYIRRRERAINTSARTYGFTRQDVREGVTLYLSRVDSAVGRVLNRHRLVPGSDIDLDSKRLAEEKDVYANHVQGQAHWSLTPRARIVCECCGEYRSDRLIWSHYCTTCGVPVCYRCAQNGQHTLYHESLQEQATEAEIDRQAKADRDDELIERAIERRHGNQ